MIQTIWLDKYNGVRYWQFGTQWTWDKFYNRLQEDIDEMALSDKPIDVILDFSKTRQLPEHFLTHILIGSKRANENVESIVFLGNPVVHALMDSFHLLNHDFLNRYGFADNLEQAMQIIAQHHPYSLS